MNLPRPALAALQAAALIACGTASAADAGGDAISVTATRQPVDKSYRKMVAGMDVFEAKHGLAPKASLRFKLLPRKQDTRMDGIELQILGDRVVIPLDLAPDRSFALERSAKALDEDASVRPNRKESSLTWRTEIRTPGLPPNTRRLGDLRLECQVGLVADLVSNALPIIGRISNFIDRARGYCEQPDAHYYFFSDYPLFSVALVAGTRREILPVGDLYAGSSLDALSANDLAHCDCEVLLDRTYFMPLGDVSWPDDTLVELEYMDESNANAVSR
jgi:hypothetical protein